MMKNLILVLMLVIPSAAMAYDYNPALDDAAEQDSGIGVFGGYNCLTADCSGHNAGYNWADSHSIDDELDCTNASLSFEEGCKAYIQEQEEEQED